MDGTGVPLVTPFDSAGEIDEAKLRELVGWVEDRGVDFIVPCGSNSEAELMSVEERARVVEVVTDEADGPVLAGTGHPGFQETVSQTALAADAGADAAIVVTPFYYPHDQETLAAYYRDLADEADLPVYLYSVPPFTDVHLEPETVGDLSEHENIAGMKDSAGDVTRFQREREYADDGFELFVGSGGVYSHALDSGADGGILALANVAPERASEVYERHGEGDRAGAHAVNRSVVDLNQAVTATYGIPGLKAAMRTRGAPAGQVRRPHRPVGPDVESELERHLESVGV